MILNFIWTIAISSVFPMLILLGMILGIEFANQLYYDNNSRTFDFCLRSNDVSNSFCSYGWFLGIIYK